MDLKKQSELISCNRITFLDKKYNLYNNFLLEKQFMPNCLVNNKQTYDKTFINSSFISKKSCIYKSTEPDQGEWEKQFMFNQISDNKLMFNINTKAKANQDVNCP